MSAILLFALFAASGVLALASIRQSWRRHGAAVLAVRGELRDCSEWREVRVTIRTVKVHPAGASILRPDFTGRRRSPAPDHALPAAA